MRSGKIMPFAGDGQHKSVTSLLAEIMNDPHAKSVIVFSFDDKGDMIFSQYNCTRREMAFAGAAALEHAVKGS